MNPGFFTMAPHTSLALVLLMAVAGGLVGLAAGWISVRLEKVEKLEAEELEERAEYEAKVVKEDDQAKSAPWIMEKYGWTWLEKYLAVGIGMVLFGLFTYHQGWGRLLLVHLLWVSVLIHVIVFDMKHRLILNRITYPTVILAFALVSVTPGLTYWSAAVGAIGVALVFFLPAIIFPGSIGIGDAKLGLFVGAVTGFAPSFSLVTAAAMSVSEPFNGMGGLFAVFYAGFLGGGVSILLLITRIRGLHDAIAYGPYICAGTILVLYQTVPLAN